MDDQHWNVPIWSNGKSCYDKTKTGRSFTYPDWGNVGSDVLCGGAATTLLLGGTSGMSLNHSAPFATRNRTYNFYKQKDIERKFPLEKTLPFAYPLLRPRKVYSSGNVTDSKCFAKGNCLDVLELSGQVYVVHPRWKMGQQRVITSRLKRGIYDKEIETQEDNLYFKLSKCAYFPHDEPLYQIVAKEVNNVGYVLLRSRTDAQLVSLQFEEQGIKSSQCDVVNNYLTTDVALSDTLPGVWALACANGEVLLQNTQVENSLWRTNFQKRRVKPRLSSYQCDFGKHPLSLIVGNESTIWMCDTRMKARTNILGNPENSGVVRVVLEVKEMEKYYSNFQEICSFTHIKTLPYLYVVTSDSVYVVDERFCKMPVMSWKHMLMKRPSYTRRQKFGDMEFLMLANNHEKRTCVIANEWVGNNYNTWCRGVSLPKHFRIAEDTMDFANKQDLWFRHQVHNRLESTWSGAASLVHPNDNSSMLFLSSYNSGDIFSQLFKVTQGQDKGLPQNLPVEDTQCGKKILSKWEEDTVKVSINKSLGDSFTYFDASSFYHRVVCEGISEEIKEMIAGLPEPIIVDKGAGTGSSCSESKADARNEKDIWQVRELVWKLKNDRQNKNSQNTSKQNSKNPRWLDSLLDNYISDYHVTYLADVSLPGNSEDDGDILSKYLPRKVASSLKLENLKNCQDFLAPRILSVWQGGETEGSSSSGKCDSPKPSFNYHTAPFDFTNFSILPSKLQVEGHHDDMVVPDINFDDQSSQVSQSTSQVSRGGASQLSENTLLSEKKSKMRYKKKQKKHQRVDGF